MIIRKKWRYIGRYKSYKKEKWYTIIDFDGWWLFGIIPIYLIILDKFEAFDNMDLREGIYSKYDKI